MRKTIPGFGPGLPANSLHTILVGTLFLILNSVYLGPMSIPESEAKWLLLGAFAPALLLFPLGAALLRNTGLSLRLTTFQLAVLLFLAWAALSGTWTLNGVSFPATLLDLAALVMVLIFLSVALDPRHQSIHLFFLGSFSTLVAVIGLLQYFGLDGGLFYQSVKPAAFFVNKNYATPVVAAALPLLGLSLLAGRPRRRSLLPLLCFHLNFAYLLVAGTKSSWLACFASLAIFAGAAVNWAPLRKHFSGSSLRKALALMASGIAFSLLLALVHRQGPFPAMSRDLLGQTGTVFSLALLVVAAPALLAGLLYLWRLAATRHRLLPPALLLLFLLAGLAATLSSQPPVLDRINAGLAARATGLAPSESWTSRLPVWINTLAIIGDHPLRGVGLGSFEASYPLYHDRLAPDRNYSTRLWFGGAHNEPLQLLAELGLVGLALGATVLVLISRCFLAQLKSAEPARAVMLTGCYLGGLALGIDSLFNPVFHQPSSLMLLAFFLGVIHSSLYAEPVQAERFCFRRDIGPGQRYLYLTPPFILGFLLLSVTAPLAVRRYEGFVRHKEAIAFFHANQEDYCYYKLREANGKWPYSSTILSETAAESYLFLLRHFSQDNLNEARRYNSQALRALPYHYNPNLIRISLLKYLPGGRSEIGNYAPLLLKVAPADKLAEARLEINS